MYSRLKTQDDSVSCQECRVSSVRQQARPGRCCPGQSWVSISWDWFYPGSGGWCRLASVHWPRPGLPRQPPPASRGWARPVRRVREPLSAQGELSMRSCCSAPALQVSRPSRHSQDTLTHLRTSLLSSDTSETSESSDTPHEASQWQSVCVSSRPSHAPSPGVHHHSSFTIVGEAQG